LLGLEDLPHAGQVNIILLSDHGLAAYREDPKPFILDQYVDLENTTIIEGGSYLFLHFDQENLDRAADIVKAINGHWNHGRAYLPSETPRQWHVDDNPRFPDVILMPEAGYAVLSNAERTGKLIAGDHGWAPETPGMHGFFVASGPNIKPGVSLGPIEMVDVYPLMLSILGLDSPEKMDGDAGKLANILYIEPD
jgi:hypothetical protein